MTDIRGSCLTLDSRPFNFSMVDVESAAPLLDVIRSLAFVGDLAMGQPTNHSPRTAWIAGQLARETEADGEDRKRAVTVALLRWSGCTANAPEFTRLFGDDVASRQSMLALPTTGSSFQTGMRHQKSSFMALAQIHCEVAGGIAMQLRLDERVQYALCHMFESFDGTGAPGGQRGSQVPASVYTTLVAGDLEIFSRLYGLPQACKVLEERADVMYPKELATVAIRRAKDWFAELDDDPMLTGPCSLDASFGGNLTSLEILAHVIDLKLPWMTGHSTQTARFARQAARNLGLPTSVQEQVRRAALIHGMGRAEVPNAIWDTPGKLAEPAWERVRLVPYWTGRAARQIGSLAAEAEIASHAYERLDGSGYFREIKDSGMSIEARILAAAVALTALQAPRPWRPAYTESAAAALLTSEAAAGKYDPDVVRGLLEGQASSNRRPSANGEAGSLLTERELEVLRLISLGVSTKSLAQMLGITPRTVRAHVENVLRKLECSTRAAATLKATQLGLLQ